jgi:hypothetical protein
MTSKQIDALQQMADAADAFVHAFLYDYPSKTAEIETDAALLKTWADSNPAPESKP